MKTINNIKIIGVDAGYGNMKTANFCFRTGLTAYDTEPLFTKNMLVYEGRYYLIGEGHKTYTAEKTLDEDYYILTLAAIAMELNREQLTEADVYLSAGLPLSWVLEQKDDYLAWCCWLKYEVPIWEKANLTFEEAAAYFGIGINKLRDLTSNDNCPYVLWIGSKRLIKRRAFERYLETAFSV